ncbi:type II toxin-antitoxin system RelE/ParE family toxin [Candidatus Margulisiibacteriota bacterium]
MAKYELVITNPASKDIKPIPKNQLKKICETMRNLLDNPISAKSKKLAGSKRSYRIRVGDYRILYSISNKVITIFAIGHRKDVYRKT